MDFLNMLPHFCLFDKLIGIECPVCGTTRAFCELSNGNFNKALSFNISSLFVAFFIGMQIPLRSIAIIKKKTRNKVNILSKYLGYMILIIILTNWFIRLPNLN